MIDFEHVSKEYKKGGRLALEDINFHVDEGEFVFLLGHSGAGKSTLLKLILRETLPTSGKVTVLGKDVAKLRRRGGQASGFHDAQQRLILGQIHGKLLV